MSEQRAIEVGTEVRTEVFGTVVEIVDGADVGRPPGSPYAKIRLLAPASSELLTRPLDDLRVMPHTAAWPPGDQDS